MRVHVVLDSQQQPQIVTRVTGLPRQLFLLDDEVVSDTEAWARLHVMIVGSRRRISQRVEQRSDKLSSLIRRV